MNHSRELRDIANGLSFLVLSLKSQGVSKDTIDSVIEMSNDLHGIAEQIENNPNHIPFDDKPIEF